MTGGGQRERGARGRCNLAGGRGNSYEGWGQGRPWYSGGEDTERAALAAGRAAMAAAGHEPSEGLWGWPVCLWGGWVYPWCSCVWSGRSKRVASCLSVRGAGQRNGAGGRQSC